MLKVRKQLPTKLKGVIVDMSNVGIGAETNPSYYVDNTMFPLEGVTVTGVDRSLSANLNPLKAGAYILTAPTVGLLIYNGASDYAADIAKYGKSLSAAIPGVATKLLGTAALAWTPTATGDATLKDYSSLPVLLATRKTKKELESELAAMTASRDSAITANASRAALNDTVPNHSKQNSEDSDKKKSEDNRSLREKIGDKIAGRKNTETLPLKSWYKKKWPWLVAGGTALATNYYTRTGLKSAGNWWVNGSDSVPLNQSQRDSTDYVIQDLSEVDNIINSALSTNNDIDSITH